VSKKNFVKEGTIQSHVQQAGWPQKGFRKMIPGEKVLHRIRSKARCREELYKRSDERNLFHEREERGGEAACHGGKTTPLLLFFIGVRSERSALPRVKVRRKGNCVRRSEKSFVPTERLNKGGATFFFVGLGSDPSDVSGRGVGGEKRKLRKSN